MSKILALDLGTKTGWALLNGGVITGGTAVFPLKKNQNPGQRWARFRGFLNDVQSSAGALQAVYYEDVMFHAGIQAAHVYGGYMAVLQMFCDIWNVPLSPVGVTQIKKHWTGKGAAKKGEMIAEAKKRGFHPVDDNHADALAILTYAIERGKNATQ